MSDEELIEKISRAIVQSFFDIGHNIYYENPETLRTVSLAAKTALNVCRPIIEEPLRAENKKLREELEMMRKACRKACKANYKLGIDKGKEKAIIRMRDMGE